MNRRLSALLFLLGTVGWCQGKGARTFELELPSGWKTAKDLVLVLEGLEVPAGRGVVLRLYPAGEVGAESLGSVSVLAKSRDAKGVQRLPKIEMNLGEEFHRWAAKRSGHKISVSIKPYAGIREAPDLVWQVQEIRLEAR